MEVIPTGVDLDLIRQTERKLARARFGIPEGVPVVAYSGRIAKEKSIDVLIHAFSLLSRRLPEAHLLLIGGGPWYLPCRRLADSLGVGERVHFTGYVEREQVFDCLAESHVFAFASLTDTQGVAVLEAMALGCPPVAVRSGAVADVIRDGVDGMLVEPDAHALAEGLCYVLGSDSLRGCLAGEARVRAEKFSASRMASRLARLYERLVGA
jgi:glycosyltransferase involved in cell wall biosynthesis